MKTPILRLDETPVELKRLLDAETDARKHPRVQALSLLQTQPARTRRPVARPLGVSRNTVGRWLAAYERGGLAQLLTIAKAPGKTPLVPRRYGRPSPNAWPNRRALRVTRPLGTGCNMNMASPWPLRRSIGSSAISCAPN
jgi:hypothetical protein